MAFISERDYARCIPSRSGKHEKARCLSSEAAGEEVPTRFMTLYYFLKC